jgi:hypothetical protein
VAHIVDDDVGRPLLARLAAGDIGQGDQAVEAVLEHRGPGRDPSVDCVEILLGDAGLGLDGDRQVGVVPGVAVGVVVVEDDQRLGIGVGQPAVDAGGGWLGVGWALAVRGERSVTRSAPTTTGPICEPASATPP